MQTCGWCSEAPRVNVLHSGVNPAHAFSLGAVRHARSALMRSHTPPRREAATPISPRGHMLCGGAQLLHAATRCGPCRRSLRRSLAVASDDAVEEVCHVLGPRLDGLERLGEAAGDVVVLGDVDGGDFTLRDA
eukprot:6211605-Prymnesium_polylepis.1